MEQQQNHIYKYRIGTEKLIKWGARQWQGQKERRQKIQYLSTNQIEELLKDSQWRDVGEEKTHKTLESVLFLNHTKKRNLYKEDLFYIGGLLKRWKADAAIQIFSRSNTNNTIQKEEEEKIDISCSSLFFFQFGLGCTNK